MTTLCACGCGSPDYLCTAEVGPDEDSEEYAVTAVLAQVENLDVQARVRVLIDALRLAMRDAGVATTVVAMSG